MSHTINSLSLRNIHRTNLSYRIERGTTLLPTVGDIRKLNEEVGNHFFDAATLSFFSSRILDVCCPMIDGSTLFITSERSGFQDPTRMWTVRRAYANGDIETVGDFGEHASRSRAVSAMESYRRVMDAAPHTKKNRATHIYEWGNGGVTMRIVAAKMGAKGPTVTTHRWTFSPGDTRPAQFPTDLWEHIVAPIISTPVAA